MSEQQKIIITGASGFIGSALVEHFHRKGWIVVAFVRAVPDEPAHDIVYVRYDLARTPPDEAFADADALVHCAYVKNDIETNISGARRLLALSRKHGIERRVFLSSCYAHEHAVSKYGRQKLAIERLFDTELDCVLRVGVVLGSGGLFKQMSDHVREGGRVPLIDGGRQPMQTIHVDELVQIIDKVIETNVSGTFSVAEPEPVAYRKLFSAVSHKLGVRPRFISVPFFVLNVTLMCTEALRLKLPVARENVLGLRSVRAFATKDDLDRLGVTVSSYKESLAKL